MVCGITNEIWTRATSASATDTLGLAGITTKLAEALEVSVDYMLGRERFGKYDNEAIKRLEGIQKMDIDTRSKLFDIIDTYLHP